MRTTTIRKGRRRTVKKVRDTNHFTGPVAKRSNASKRKAPLVSKTITTPRKKKTVKYGKTSTYGRGKRTVTKKRR